MSRPLKQFRLWFEDLPKLGRADNVARLIRDQNRAANLELLKQAYGYIYRVVKWLRGHLIVAVKQVLSLIKKTRKYGFKIEIKITPLKIILLFLLGWQVWPHHSNVIAEGNQTKPPTITIKKPLKHIQPVSAYVNPLVVPYTPPAQTHATSPVRSSDCGDNQYAHFIYMRESGCNTSAVNPRGCRGIGQACPGSKLPCGADYACQNAYFTNYAISRYGSWANAYAFWVNNHWW